MSGVSAKMSRGSYEKTASVESTLSLTRSISACSRANVRVLRAYSVNGP